MKMEYDYFKSQSTLDDSARYFIDILKKNIVIEQKHMLERKNINPNEAKPLYINTEYLILILSLFGEGFNTNEEIKNSIIMVNF